MKSVFVRVLDNDEVGSASFVVNDAACVLEATLEDDGINI